MYFKLIKSKILYLLFIVFCLVGCIYHVTQITQVYLTFQTKIDVSFDSTNQIVVPLISFCKPRFTLMINQSQRDFLEIIKTSPTPAAIQNTTFGIADVFLFCRYVNEKGKHHFSKKCNQGFQTTKTVNYWNVCYHFKHPQFIHNSNRYKGIICQFWLYHHHHSEFTLYLSSDKNIPNGDSPNALKLISKLS